MNGSFRIRPFRQDDLPAVLDLLRVSLGEHLPRTPAWFGWKHLDNPFGRSILRLAEDREGIVGLRAFMRWELQTADGQALRCVRPVDTATHPRARRRGVFRSLTEAALEEAVADGVDLVFNTPNSRSGAGYRSMGWSEVGRIGVLVRPLLLRRGGGGLAPAATACWEELAASARPARGLRTPRTAQYLEWRFARHPVADYRLTGTGSGSAVLRHNLRRGRRELVVSELVGPDLDGAIRRSAREGDAAYLVGWFSRGSPERRAALRAGLLPVPGVTALTLVARPLATRGPDPSRPEHWDLAMSDLELL